MIAAAVPNMVSLWEPIHIGPGTWNSAIDGMMLFLQTSLPGPPEEVCFYLAQPTGDRHTRARQGPLSVLLSAVTQVAESLVVTTVH